MYFWTVQIFMKPVFASKIYYNQKFFHQKLRILGEFEETSWTCPMSCPVSQIYTTGHRMVQTKHMNAKIYITCHSILVRLNMPPLIAITKNLNQWGHNVVKQKLEAYKWYDNHHKNFQTYLTCPSISNVHQMTASSHLQYWKMQKGQFDTP